LIEIYRTANAIIGPIRIELTHSQHLVHLAGIDLERDIRTRSKKVLLAYGAREDKLVRTRETKTKGKASQRSFLDFEVHIDLVGCACNRLGLHLNLLEVTKAIDSISRETNALAVVPGGLELTHLSAYNLVTCLGVAADINSAHVDSTTRVHLKLKVHHLVGAIDSWHWGHVRKGIAKFTQAVGNCLGYLKQFLIRENLTRFQADELLELVLLTQQIAGELQIAKGKSVALVDHEGNEYLSPIR